MSDLVKRLRATTDGATVNPDGPAAADHIEKLEAALQKIADRTRNAHLLSYAGHMELQQVSRFINGALAGWKR